MTSMANLAIIYSNQGKYGKAEELELKVVDLCNKVLGPEHAQTLTSMANLAITYSNQGKYEEAEELELLVVDLQSWI